MTLSATYTGATWATGLPPGVYEDRPRYVVPKDVRMDVAAFLGLAERGPVGVPVVIESFEEFGLHFGHAGGGRLLPQAVAQFFANGGRRCVVARGLGSAAATQLNLPGVAQHGAPVRLVARSPGTWGNRVSCSVAVRGRSLLGNLHATDDPTVFVTEVGRAPDVGTLIQLTRHRTDAELAIQGDGLHQTHVFVRAVRPLDRTNPAELQRWFLGSGNADETGSLAGELANWVAVVIDSIVAADDRRPTDMLGARELVLDLTLELDGATEAWNDCGCHPDHPRFLLGRLSGRGACEAFATSPLRSDAPTDPSWTDARTADTDPGSAWVQVDDSHLADGDPHPLTVALEIDPELLVESGSAEVTLTPASYLIDGVSGDRYLEGAEGVLYVEGDDGLETTSRSDLLTGLDALSRYDDRNETEPVSLVAVPDLVHPAQPGAFTDDVEGPEPTTRFSDCIAGEPAAPDATEVFYPALAFGAGEDLDDVRARQRELVSHCEAHGGRVAVLDLPPQLDAGQIVNWRRRLASPRAALYAPYLQTVPVEDETAPLLVTPPSGAVCGIVATRERTRRVHVAPANITLQAVAGLHAVAELPQPGFLHEERVNVIRATEHGYDLLGSRTTSLDASWTHLPVRRLVDYLERQLLIDTRWAVFEPNNRVLWSRLRQTVQRRLRPLFDDGAFAGKDEASSYFVRCDGTTSSLAERDEGRVVVLVGLAPAVPSEFIVFRLVHLGDGESLIGEGAA